MTTASLQNIASLEFPRESLLPFYFMLPSETRDKIPCL